MRIKQNQVICTGMILISLLLITGNVGASMGDPDYNIVLTQESDTNPVGDEHTVIATVTIADPSTGNPGDPASDVSVDFKVISGPNNGTSDTGTTNVGGQAVFTYTGSKEGLDIINASIEDSQGIIIASNHVYKFWRHPGTDYVIQLAPESDTNPIGTEHTVTATVTNEDGTPVLGMGLYFMVTVTHNIISDTIYTDANGQAIFSYTGTETGMDEIEALRIYDYGISNIVIKLWTPPQNEIPEFPGIALPVVLIICLAFFFQHRRI